MHTGIVALCWRVVNVEHSIAVPKRSVHSSACVQNTIHTCEKAGDSHIHLSFYLGRNSLCMSTMHYFIDIVKTSSQPFK